MVRARTALVAVVAAGPALAGSVTALGIATTGYDPAAATISSLAAPGQPWAPAAQAALVTYGLVVLAAARPLAARAPGREQVLSALLAAVGVAVVVAALAPKAAPGAPPTATGPLHVAAALVGGAAAVAAMGVVARRGTAPAARGQATLAAAATVLAAATFGQMWGSPTYGLVERVALGVPVLWLTTLAATSLRDPRHRRETPTRVRWSG